MKELLIDLPNEKYSEQLALKLSGCLEAPLLLTFRGEIGAGKTTIIRSMLKALGVKAAIKSPTFSLIESYQCSHLEIHHFDLYRIQDEDELEFIGFRDYFSLNSICIIEWPERISRPLENVDLDFSLLIIENGRQVRIQALTSAGIKMLSSISGEL